MSQIEPGSQIREWKQSAGFDDAPRIHHAMMFNGSAAGDQRSRANPAGGADIARRNQANAAIHFGSWGDPNAWAKLFTNRLDLSAQTETVQRETAEIGRALETIHITLNQELRRLNAQFR